MSDFLKHGKLRLFIILLLMLSACKASKTPESFLEDSLKYYQEGKYEKCIEAANEALKLRPNYDLAYNNICAAYNALKQWDKAIYAGEKAVNLNPNNQRARNNLMFARTQKAISEGKAGPVRTAAIPYPPNTPEYFLEMSLREYRAGQYQKCIDAANEALKLKPNYDLAYNNICAAYNALKQWDKAIEAGEKAVKLNPNNQLAKNNLAAAKAQKAASQAKSGTKK